MKYIRTKTYIYEKPDDKYIENNQVLHFANRPTEEEKIGFSCYAEYEYILKEADNIEELCDEFVVCKGNESPISSSMDDKGQYEMTKAIIMMGMLIGENCWMKLAIWTDKGLIYVAKMNEKGEFELI